MLLHQWVLMLRELTDTNKLKFKDDTKRQTPTQDNFALPASIFKDTRKLSPKQVPGKGKVSTEQIHTGRSSVILVVTRKNRIFYICPDRESGERERERERVGINLVRGRRAERQRRLEIKVRMQGNIQFAAQ
jgi:hypothetical protein